MKNPSLQARLLAATVGGVAVVLLLGGIAIYTAVRTLAWSEFDRNLMTRARALAEAVEQNRKGEIKPEFAEDMPPEFTARGAEFFDIRTPDGARIVDSPSLAGREIPVAAAITTAGAIQPTTLPSGERGRLAAIRFTPNDENHSEPNNVVRYTPREAVFILARDTRAIDRELRRVAWLIFGACAAAVVACAAALAFIVPRTLRPVGRVASDIAGIGQTDLGERVDAAGVPREMLPIVHRLNEMLDRIQAAFAREKAFTGDAAHELRTPLAGLRTLLEVTRRQPRAAADYQQTLTEALAISAGMERLVASLLTLARADSGQLQAAREPIDLAPFISKSFAPFAAPLESRGIATEWRLAPGVAVLSDPRWLGQVLSNLFDNAVSYCNTGGAVRVDASTDGGATRIRIANTGCTIAPADAPRVFERFWRSDAARHEVEHHAGLGLPLCRRIATLLGGSIDVTTTDEGWFIVTLTLPSAPSGSRSSHPDLAIVGPGPATFPLSTTHGRA